MKKSEIIFSTILVPIDYILLVFAGMSAFFVRYSRIYTENIREVVFSLQFGDYMKFVYVLAIAWIVIFAFSGIFSMRPQRKIFGLLTKVFLACSTGTLFVIVVFFFSRELFSSRFIILAVWIISIIYINLAHLAVRYIQRLCYMRGIGAHRVILVGRDATSRELANEFSGASKLGIQVVLVVGGYSDELRASVRKLDNEGMIDEIIQADANLSREEIIMLMDLANEYHLDFKYAADMLGARRSNIEINTVAGIPLVEIRKTPLDGWGRVVKRTFDIVGSLAVFVVLSPFFLLLPVVIKADSRGKAIYRTERVGGRGKRFYLYKFRSMIEGADTMKDELADKNERADGPLFKMVDDPRITRVGKFLRRTSLDELPNFWNVLLGNMSLVGPRPHEPREVEKYQKHHKKLLDIKPGITGLAQVSGRSTLNFESEVKLDTLYIETWSLKLDIIILFKTPLTVIFAKTAA